MVDEAVDEEATRVVNEVVDEVVDEVVVRRCEAVTACFRGSHGARYRRGGLTLSVVAFGSAFPKRHTCP